MTDVSMTIGGERAAAPSTFGVVNPATGEIHAEAPDCGKEQLDQAFDAAAKAFVDWRRDEAGTAAIPKAAASSPMAAGERVGPMLTAEQGKPIAARTMESNASGLAALLRRAGDAPRGDPGRRRRLAEVVRRPMGVVAPSRHGTSDRPRGLEVGPALLAGNTMVLKPSPFTPRSTLLMGEILNEVLPPGVLNVVSGGDELGRWMTAHPMPRKVGSPARWRPASASRRRPRPT